MIDVVVADQYQKKDAVAELNAIHYLLEDLKIAGESCGGVKWWRQSEALQIR